MTPEQYRPLALRTEYTPKVFVQHASPSKQETKEINARLLHGAFAVTEGGELIDQIKKHLIYGKEIDRTNVIEEVGDLLWYCNLALDAVGASFSDAFTANIEKLKKRYPDKFTSEAALNRDLDGERKVLEANLTPDQKTALANDARRDAVIGVLRGMVGPAIDDETHHARQAIADAFIRAAHS